MLVTARCGAIGCPHGGSGVDTQAIAETLGQGRPIVRQHELPDPQVAAKISPAARTGGASNRTPAHGSHAPKRTQHIGVERFLSPNASRRALGGPAPYATRRVAITTPALASPVASPNRPPGPTRSAGRPPNAARVGVGRKGTVTLAAARLLRPTQSGHSTPVSIALRRRESAIRATRVSSTEGPSTSRDGATASIKDIA